MFSNFLSYSQSEFKSRQHVPVAQRESMWLTYPFLNWLVRPKCFGTVHYDSFYSNLCLRVTHLSRNTFALHLLYSIKQEVQFKVPKRKLIVMNQWKHWWHSIGRKRPDNLQFIQLVWRFSTKKEKMKSFLLGIETT